MCVCVCVCEYTLIYTTVCVVLFWCFLNFKKHVSGCQNQWGGPGSEGPETTDCSVCACMCRRRAWHRPAGGRLLVFIFRGLWLALLLLCIFYRKHVFLIWKKVNHALLPPSQLQEGVRLAGSSLPHSILWPPSWQGPQGPAEQTPWVLLSLQMPRVVLGHGKQSCSSHVYQRIWSLKNNVLLP